MCSQPMLPQIAGRFSQYTDSLLNTQSVHQLPAPIPLLVILPRFMLLIELASHVMCQSFQLVCLPPLKEPLLSLCWNPKSLALISPIHVIGGKVYSFTMLISGIQIHVESTCGSRKDPQNAALCLSRVLVFIWRQLNADRLHLKIPRQLSIRYLSPGYQCKDFPHLNVRFPEDQSWLGIVFQYSPIINLLCPAVSLPVTQASFPFIRWCSAAMQQPDKIHSLQEVWGI